jgi:hypothetical protein
MKQVLSFTVNGVGNQYKFGKSNLAKYIKDLENIHIF